MRIVKTNISGHHLSYFLFSHHSIVKWLCWFLIMGREETARRQGRTIPGVTWQIPDIPVFDFMRTDWTLFSPFKLGEILKFGLDKLLSSEGSTVDEIDLESILGETKDGQWVSDALPTAEEGSREQEEGSKSGVRAAQRALSPWART